MEIKAKKILIMGLPGAGKTYLAEKLVAKISDVEHLNADQVRSKYDDWDFSEEGRLRQAKRMKTLANEHIQAGKHVVVDFVCPTKETRDSFDADITIWVDTISEGRFEDTNKAFIPPTEKEYNFRITEKSEGDFWPTYLAKRIMETGWDGQAPTVQLLGRWQPWHEGHRALFQRAIEKTGQVAVMVRDCHGVGDNPFCQDTASDLIRNNLEDMYKEGIDYVIIPVPNITHITYGRTVGYTIAQEHFDKDIEDVSATKKREMLRKEGKIT